MEARLSVVKEISLSMLWVNTKGSSAIKLFLDPAFDAYLVFHDFLAVDELMFGHDSLKFLDLNESTNVYGHSSCWSLLSEACPQDLDTKHEVPLFEIDGDKILSILVWQRLAEVLNAWVFHQEYLFYLDGQDDECKDGGGDCKASSK